MLTRFVALNLNQLVVSDITCLVRAVEVIVFSPGLMDCFVSSSKVTNDVGF